MRKLTLNEKITLKGKLSHFKVPAKTLVRLDMETAVYLFGVCTRWGITDYAKYKG